MILRIVKMTFQAHKLAEFHQLFDQHKHQIRHQKGCQHLELYEDPSDARVRFTYSHWDSQADLDAYRHSDLFGIVWPATKQLFADRPQAFSLQFLERID
ncbi:MAG: antibiotic biosynthesis monooxygenase family protein [Bacteroidota bacterium]